MFWVFIGYKFFYYMKYCNIFIVIIINNKKKIGLWVRIEVLIF